MRLTKHHGLGNDFLVALDERHPGALAVDGDLARRLCDRRRGIGADGLIHGTEPTPQQAANGVDVVMHLFNSDGGRAEISGNGIRCLGQAVARQRDIEHGIMTVLTDAGLRPLEIAPGDDGNTVNVSVGMGVPRPGPAVPTALDEFFVGMHGTVDMGNPHLVILVNDPDGVELASQGAWLEQQFPHGVNVEYISVDANRTDVRLRVWERGAGITEACGTGACAAAFEANRWGLVDGLARVTMPGGAADVRLETDGSVTLIGPSVHIAEVEFELAPGATGQDAPGTNAGRAPVPVR